MDKTTTWTNEVIEVPLSERRHVDYHFLFSKGITQKERDKHRIGDMWINGLVCLKCKDFVRSRNQHDFRYCSCGACAVDGGSWMARYIGNPDDYITVTENFTDV